VEECSTAVPSVNRPPCKPTKEPVCKPTREVSNGAGLDDAFDEREEEVWRSVPCAVVGAIAGIPKKNHAGGVSTAAVGDNSGEKDATHNPIRTIEKQHKRNRKEKRDSVPKKNDDHRENKSSDGVRKKMNATNVPRTFASSFDAQNGAIKDATDAKKTAWDIPRKKRRVDPNQSGGSLSPIMVGRMANPTISSIRGTTSDALNRSVTQTGGGVGNGMIPKKPSVDYSDRGIMRETTIESDRKRKKEHVATTTTASAMKQSKKKDMSKASFGSDYGSSKWGNKSSGDRRRYDDSVSGSSFSKKGHKGSESDSGKKSYKGSDRKHKRESMSPDDIKQSRKMDGSKVLGSSSSTKSKSRKQKSTEG